MNGKAGRLQKSHVAAMVCATAILALAPQLAWPSGAFIHLASAEKARTHFRPQLRDMVSGGYKQWYFAGVAFPDAMLEASRGAGSWAHWKGFFNDAAKVISRRCKDINASFIAGEMTCRQAIAFYMGAYSHVMVDYRFDSQLVRKTKQECPRLGSLAKETQKFTDEALDAVAVCKHRSYFNDSIAGQDRKFNIAYHTGLILLAAQEGANTDAMKLTDKSIREAYGKWMDGTVDKHVKLLSYVVPPCETILATGKAGSAFPLNANPWDACGWVTKEEVYWARPGSGNEPGSVEDLAHDILPKEINPVFDKLIASLGGKPGGPAFKHNGKDWPDERLVLQP